MPGSNKNGAGGINGMAKLLASPGLGKGQDKLKYMSVKAPRHPSLRAEGRP